MVRRLPKDYLSACFFVIIMKRIQMFEFTDLSWYPQLFRRIQTDYLQFAATLGSDHQIFIRESENGSEHSFLRICLYKLIRIDKNNATLNKVLPKFSRGLDENNDKIILMRNQMIKSIIELNTAEKILF